jgi:hypothetical protein
MAQNAGWEFVGDLGSVQAGLTRVAQIRGIRIGPGGTRVRVERTRRHALEVGMQGGEGFLRYQDPIHFFRALSWLIQRAEMAHDWEVAEDAQCQSTGVMLDVSRNAVLTVESLERFLVVSALMGIDRLLLYMEDVYTLEPFPYFGYLRGRYSDEELKQIDAIAADLGIEVVPCIQTLAHLGRFLQWESSQDLVDALDVLLVGSSRVDALIREMLQHIAGLFRTRRIHLGMDEAFGLGRGRYLDLNGPRPPADILFEHLMRVYQIARDEGLRPMMWSDMWFRVASPTHAYYDPAARLSDELVAQMPKDMDYVYWDYYHTDQAFYEQMLATQKAWGVPTVFAGGLWMWGSFGVNYGLTVTATEAALRACRAAGVREVFATAWGDDGTECNHFGVLLGLQWFAEYGYRSTVTRDAVDDRFRACVGADPEAFDRLRYLDEIPGVSEKNLHAANPSKYLLWQDPLTAVVGWDQRDLPVAAHYAQLAERFRVDQQQNGPWGFVFAVAEALAQTLALKATLTPDLQDAYQRGDDRAMRQLCTERLPEVRRRVEALRQAHREQWLLTYKPWGWEVLDGRYGWLLSRLASAEQRLQDQLAGRCLRLEELEAPRQTFATPAPGDRWPRISLWSRIVSAGYVCGL